MEARDQQPIKLQELFTEKRAVSPVIGVILMVAITVILAAVIGAFVLGIGGDQNETPQASLSLSEENTNNNFSIEHRGGDRIDFNDITMIVNNTRLSLTEDEDETVPSGEYNATPDNINTGETTFVELNEDLGEGEENVRVRLLHEPSDSIIIDRSVDITFD